MERQRWLSAGLALAALAAAPAGAASRAARPERTRPERSARPRSRAQMVIIADRPCFVIRASADGLNPEQRMERVHRRLMEIFQQETIRPSDVQMVDTGEGMIEVRVGPLLLVTVTTADARANGAKNPETLARAWVRNLREALPLALATSEERQMPAATTDGF
jgi:hypothetical protein